MLQQTCENCGPSEGVWVTNNSEAESRPSNGDIKPLRLLQKANVANRVGADGGHDDEIRLPPLERVH